ncbi:MAG: rhomboid family intramembrane serine protease [Alphaproteobacteria bacterium]|nr:MAG: rhomboid family intramembrane serine protease [Alphaproteobacteria bacterium]
MFPIRDHNPSETFPLVTVMLIAVNVAVFLSTMGVIYGPPVVQQRFFLDWALIPARLEMGDGGYTLITSMFLHGGLLHLAGNMLFLWIFGDNLEDQMGHLGFLIFYLACGVAAGLTHVIFAPGSTVPTVGASGAIAGVMGGYLLLFPRARVDVVLIFFIFVQIVAVPAWFMLGLWFVLQLINGSVADPNLGGVAYWAHAGGFLAGVVLTLPVWLLRGGARFWRVSHGHPMHPEMPVGRYSYTDVPVVRRRRR